jgi:uncharacterized protein YecE (DUF72 family)
MERSKPVARLRVGTSGWSYPEWRGHVYPARLLAARWLAFYATLFDTVEVNASFYRLLRRADAARWRDTVPDDFVFALKGSRFITHMLRFTQPQRALRRFFAPVKALGDKTGPIVFQTPPTFAVDPARLAAFLEALPPGRRYAFEFRHPSWHVPGVLRLLRRHNAAFVPFEIGRLRGPRRATADFVYVRLHGRKPGYRGNYTRQALGEWADWIRRQLRAGRDAYVYFDNTAERDHAARNAETLRGLVRGTAARAKRRSKDR